MKKYYFDELGLDQDFFMGEEEEWEDELLGVLKTQLEYDGIEDYDGIEIIEVDLDEEFVSFNLY